LINKKKKFLPFVVLLAAAILVQLIQLDRNWDRMDGDDAQYILHARSLLVHHKYNDPNLVYTPTPFYGSKSAPPGWPILLLPVVALFGTDMLVLKLYVLLFALASGWLVYRVIRFRTGDEKLGFWTAAVYYFSMTTIVFSRVVYSEWPYLLVSLIVVNLSLQEHSSKQSWLKWMCMGIGLGLCLLFRTVGVALVAAVFIVMALAFLRTKGRRGKRLLAFAVVAFSMIAVYQAAYQTVRPEKSPGYEEQFLAKDIDFQERGKANVADVLSRVPQNLTHFIKALFPLLFGRTWHEYAAWVNPSLARPIDAGLYAAGAVLILLILLGAWRALLRGPTVVEFYTLFYFGIMCVVWFRYEVYRYLMLMIPFLWLYLAMGMQWLVGKAAKHALAGRFLTCFFVCFFAVNVLQATAEVYRYKYSENSPGNLFKPYLEIVAWLKGHVKPGQMVIADDPRWYALETGLPVTMFPITGDSRKVLDYIRQWPDAVVVYDIKRRFSKFCLYPVLEDAQNGFFLIHTIDHLQVYGTEDAEENR
jgi:4-amino-4-deoxy-L-arabinose transferase-like glycosyltransferase